MLPTEVIYQDYHGDEEPLHKYFSVVELWKNPFFLDFTVQVVKKRS